MRFGLLLTCGRGRFGTRSAHAAKADASLRTRKERRKASNCHKLHDRECPSSGSCLDFAHDASQCWPKMQGLPGSVGEIVTEADRRERIGPAVTPTELACPASDKLDKPVQEVAASVMGRLATARVANLQVTLTHGGFSTLDLRLFT